MGLHKYFLTLCTGRRQPWFRDADTARSVIAQLLRYAGVLGFDVIAYCVMPDHVHALVEGRTDHADLRLFVHRWKRSTGFEWRRRSSHPLWQEGYFDYILRDEDATAGIVRYIVGNPLRAGLVEQIADYPWTGSSVVSLQALAEMSMDWQPPWKAAGRRRV